MKLTLATMLDPRGLGARSAVAPGDLWAGPCDVGAESVATLIEAQRGALVRCTTWLLGERHAAQRLVDSALADAAASSPGPRDPAALRRWLFGFVKRAVVHALRRELRAVPFRDDSHEDGGDGAPAFLADGHWCNEPAAWGDGKAAVAEAGFQATLERCIDRLPTNTARLFAMREVLGLDTREISETLGLHEETCASMLCRARLAVHQRMQREWFAVGAVQ